MALLFPGCNDELAHATPSVGQVSEARATNNAPQGVLTGLPSRAPHAPVVERRLLRQSNGKRSHQPQR